MKIIVPLTSQSMTVDEYMSDASNASDFLTERLQSIFGMQYTVNVRVSKNLGYSLIVLFTNIPARSSSIEHLNAKVRLQFMMHLTNSYGKQESMDKFDFELLTMSHQVRHAGLKYRKISGKSPMEASTKLIKWFKANESIITSMES